MCLLHTVLVFPRRKQTRVRDRRERHRLPAGDSGTQLLTQTAPLPSLSLGDAGACPVASARFPALLTCCESRSHTRCCTWCRRCHRLVPSFLGKLARLTRPSRCLGDTGCNQPATAARNQPQRWLPHGKKPPRSLPPLQPQRQQLLPGGKLEALF